MNAIFRNVTTRQLVFAGLFIPLICTLIIGALQWYAVRDINAGRVIGRQIRTVQIALGVFRYSLSDAESAQFRYILTRLPGDRDLCGKFLAQARDQFDQLRQLTSGNQLQQTYLDQIEPLLTTKQDATEKSLTLEQNGDHAGALQIVSSDDSRQNMLQIEGAIENMQTVAAQLILIRLNQSLHTLRLTVALSIAGLAVNLACIAVILLVVRRLHQVQSVVTLDALKQMINYEDGKLTIEEYLRRRAEALSTHGNAQIEAEKLLSQLGRRKPGRITERVPTIDGPTS